MFKSIFLFFFLIALVAYWLPTLIAVIRRTDALVGVVLINLLLGWTVIGWIVALVMSFGSARGRSIAYSGTPYVPPAAAQGQLSPDGNHYWDGRGWQPNRQGADLPTARVLDPSEHGSAQPGA